MLYTIGECLIDFIPDKKGVSLSQVKNFSRQFGGAPANVAVVFARLGGKSAFIGKIGADCFGDFLVNELSLQGVDTSKIVRTEEANTALAFVSLTSSGEREFTFYRSPSADMLLSKDEINDKWFKKEDILHFCSVDLIEAPVKYAHLKAIKAIKDVGGRVSFDVNARPLLWSSKKALVGTILEFIPYIDILKLSTDEFELIKNISGYNEEYLLSKFSVASYIFITDGSKGAKIFHKGKESFISSYNVVTVDTTGAGDCFAGCALYYLSYLDRDTDNIERLGKFACAGAALSTTKYGAIASVPTLTEIEKMI
jgi:fructokinase